MDKKDTMSENVKPVRFTEKVIWDEWKPTFVNFLNTIPGRHGVPLKYIVRDMDVPIIDPTADMLQDYVNRAPLNGDAFNTDSNEVHTYITKFISGNPTAKVKVQAIAEAGNGRLAYQALKEHYEGVGVHAREIVRADKVLQSLHYSGEKKPHMWWDEFEKQLTFAFTTYDRIEGRQVHSEEMKLRYLCRKVNADFFQVPISTIELELSRQPMVMTYNQALSIFRNAMDSKHPPEVSSNNNRTRRINAQSSDRNGNSNSSNAKSTIASNSSSASSTKNKS